MNAIVVLLWKIKLLKILRVVLIWLRKIDITEIADAHAEYNDWYNLKKMVLF